VLVSDIAMPDDGIELIREVLTVAQTKGLHIPAIAVAPPRRAIYRVRPKSNTGSARPLQSIQMRPRILSMSPSL